MKPGWVMVWGVLALMLGGCCTDWDGEGGLSQESGDAASRSGDPAGAPAPRENVAGGSTEGSSVDVAPTEPIAGKRAGSDSVAEGEGAARTKGPDGSAEKSPVEKKDEDDGGEGDVSMPRKDKLLAVYTARLSRRDHFNDRKKRLREASLIVAQDRVNYHKNNIRDAQDGGDPLYHSTSARVELAELVAKYLADKPPIRARVLKGEPIVRVMVSESRSGRRRARLQILQP